MSSNPKFRREKANGVSTHGFVVAVGPDSNYNYFTGSRYSCHINSAKVYATAQGAYLAARYWQLAEENDAPLAKVFWETLQVLPVGLDLLGSA